MIVHYKQGTKDFTGMDNIITPLIVHAEIERELNGVFNAEILVVKDSEKKHEEIKVLDFIKIPTPAGEQLFRVVDVDDTATYTVTLFCKHVFFDLQKRLIKDTFIQQRNGTQALQQILNNLDAKTEFTAFSDITNLNNLRLVRTKGVDAILGGNSDNYLIERYKGELDVDNFKVKLLKKIGTDRGYEIREGKNLTGYNYKEDSSELCTRLMPVLFDGTLIPETYVDSENINKYDMIHTNTIKFDDIKLKERLEDGTIKPDNPEEDYVNEGYDTEAAMFAEAIKRCKQLFTEGLDKVRVQATVKFVDLVKTEQYKDFQFLHRLDLGDTVYFILEKYNLRVAERIVSYRYNSLTKEYIELELGHVQDNIFSSGGGINSGSNGSGGVGSGGGSELPNLGLEFDKWYDKVITDVTNQISSGIKDSYVLVRANEILIMDTKDVATAQKVWRWNNAGLGFSSNGYNGPYTTAMTANGQFVINEITCQRFVGNLIEAGTIQANRLSVEAKGEIREGLVSQSSFNVELGKINMSVSENTETITETNKVVSSNKTLAQQQADKAKADAIKHANDLKVAIDKEISDVEKSVTNLNTTMNGAFKDGIVTEAEAKAVKENLKRCDKEKLEADKKYDVLYEDNSLTGSAKTNLLNAKNDYNSKYTDLTNYIREVIKDGKATNSEIANVDNKNTAYNTSNATLMQRVSEATKAIEDKKKADAISSANNHTNTEIKKTNDKVAAIDIKANSINQSVSSLSEQVVSIDGEVKEKITLEQAKAQIDIKANEITQNVSVSATGNIVENSGAVNNNKESWLVQGNNSELHTWGTTNNVPSQYYFEIKSLNKNTSAYSCRFGVKGGEKYCITGYIHRDKYSKLPEVYVLASNSLNSESGTIRDITYDKAYRVYFEDVEDKWVKFKLEFTPDTTNKSAYVRIDNICDGTYEKKLRFSSIMVNRGMEMAWNDTISYTNASSQFKQLAGEMELKVERDGVIGAINLTPEAAKIKAKNIELNGATTVDNGNGKKVTIEEANYTAHWYETRKASFGFGYGATGDIIPQMLLGYHGIDNNMNNYKNPYFIQAHYPASNNPSGRKVGYLGQAYKCVDTSLQSSNGAFSGITYTDDGEIMVNPLNYFHIYSNKKNGVYTGLTPNLLATFGSSSSNYYDSYLEIDSLTNKTNGWGLVLADEMFAYAGLGVHVRIDADVEDGSMYMRPIEKNIQLGSVDYPWGAWHGKGLLSSEGIIAKNKKAVNNGTLIDGIDVITNMKNTDKIILDVSRIAGTTLAPTDLKTGIQEIDYIELCKNLLVEVKNLKKEIEKLKAR